MSEFTRLTRLRDFIFRRQEEYEKLYDDANRQEMLNRLRELEYRLNLIYGNSIPINYRRAKVEKKEEEDKRGLLH